jgi:hypothetical protein
LGFGSLLASTVGARAASEALLAAAEPHIRWAAAVLEALGNIGDFVGGIAVIATLIYLAIQVSQNTHQLRESAKLARIQARDTTFQSFCEFRSKIVCNPEVADLYYRGLRDIGSLDSADLLRFHLLADELFHIFQMSIRRAADLGLSDVDDTIQALGIDSVLKAHGVAQWWKRNRGRFPADFAALIDTRVAAVEPERSG